MKPAPARAECRETAHRHTRSEAQHTTKALAAGEDVVGGWYLTAQRLLSVCLIACSPHGLRPEIPCPGVRARNGSTTAATSSGTSSARSCPESKTWPVTS